eukprot:CAMPEP_0202980358 /NCGR_PEP_ID=MMETSP1396-20130829/86303_1 /ASSEMBLY_ACC=CAM_ASM_000872 /TAXON_ID= /ORGANISM="Pseudokeronopsis sp., Strain Brazil" /LENGTH=70 /DNA_ID=CAMNT_0049720293 /DNA_START=1259 /DNA_END=1471 /DNA_ORIENTATION=+
MVENQKKVRLNEIFDILDHDSDGYISASSIDVQTLPAEILEILSPVLCEMEELNQGLDRDEFVDAALRLY